MIFATLPIIFGNIMCDINNNEFVINSWESSYSQNNTILVTINITYITEEKEVLNFEFDKRQENLLNKHIKYTQHEEKFYSL